MTDAKRKALWRQLIRMPANDAKAAAELAQKFLNIDSYTPDVAEVIFRAQTTDKARENVARALKGLTKNP